MNIAELVSLQDKNSFKIGGSARYYTAPVDGDAVATAVAWARGHQVELFVLGRGSNLLISDAGWPGLVLHLSAFFEGIVWDGSMVIVNSGVALNNLVKEVVDHGFSGMEELAGIPGTVGGAVVMNAGAFATMVADTLCDVVCCNTVTGEITTITADKLQMGYRTTLLQQSCNIVLQARFSFARSQSREQLEVRRQEILELRRSKQPLEYPNCGSVFKRPEGGYAGTLIEACGLKGTRIGGAEVSTQHANFIVNRSAASAADVRSLIVMVQRTVYEKRGILLQPEVIFVGTFSEPLVSLVGSDNVDNG